LDNTEVLKILITKDKRKKEGKNTNTEISLSRFLKTKEKKNP